MLFAAVFLTYGLGKTNMQLSEGYYPLKASFSDVTGISSGADVKMSGVKIGTVSGAQINPDSFQADVTILLRNDVKIPIDLLLRLHQMVFLAVRILQLMLAVTKNICFQGKVLVIHKVL